MQPTTPPLWLTRTAAAHLFAAARKGCRRAGDAYAAGLLSPADWRDLVVAAVTPAVAATARLSTAAEFGATDRSDLYERVAQIRHAASDLSLRLAPRDPAARSAGLALAGAVRATHAAYERRAVASGRTGPAWERRIAGPGCPPACRRTNGAWRPAGELPTPGDDPDCLCRLEYFSGVEPPAPVPPYHGGDRVSFRLWTAAEVRALSRSQLADLSPADAGDAIAQLGGDIDDDVRAVLERVALSPRQPRRADPPNPAGGHFGDDRESLLSHLVAVPDPLCPDFAAAAGHLVRAAVAFGADSRAAYHETAVPRRVNGRDVLGYTYGPGRDALHRRMTAPARATPASRAKRGLVVVGPPAAGKSRAAAEFARSMGGVWATADGMAEAARLPEYQGWNRALLAAEGGDIATRALIDAIDAGADVVVELHGGEWWTPGGVAHLLGLCGYEVHGMAVACPPAVAAARAAARFAENPFGLADPLADPSPFAPPSPVGGVTGTRAKDLAGYPGLASWTVCEGV